MAGRPEKYVDLKIGEGALTLASPPADLETMLSLGGKHLAILWPKADGHYVVDIRQLAYVEHLEENRWDQEMDSVLVESLKEARELAHQSLNRLDENF